MLTIHTALLLGLLLAVEAPVGAAPLGWSSLQSLGGITVGDPTRMPSGWFLPVSANVSGLVQVTTKPTALNSGLICTHTSAILERSSILLTAHTGVARQGASPLCPPAQLGPIKPGKYSVFYNGPNEEAHFLSEATIAP